MPGRAFRCGMDRGEAQSDNRSHRTGGTQGAAMNKTRLRISTLMLLIVILALGMALGT